MQLAVVHTNAEPDPNWLRLLKQAAPDAPPRSLPNLEDLEIALQENSNLHGLIIHPQPERMVAEKLKRGVAPSACLLDWQNATQSVLDLHKEHWNRLTVVQSPLAISDTSRLFEFFCSAYDMTYLSNSEALLAEIAESGEQATAVAPEYVLASRQLLSMRVPSRLSRELDAASFSVSEWVHVPDLIQELLTQTESARKNAKLYKENRTGISEINPIKSENKKLTKENSTMMEQLHKTQEELGRYVSRREKDTKAIQALHRGRDYRKAKVRELQSQLDEAVKSLSAAHDELAVVRTTLNESNEKVEWLRSVRDQHKASARSLRQDIRSRDQELVRMKALLTRAHQELDGVTKSRSWRYTKLLRKLNGTES